MNKMKIIKLDTPQQLSLIRLMQQRHARFEREHQAAIEAHNRLHEDLQRDILALGMELGEDVGESLKGGWIDASYLDFGVAFVKFPEEGQEAETMPEEGTFQLPSRGLH